MTYRALLKPKQGKNGSKYNSLHYTQCLYFVVHYNFVENNEIDIKSPFIVFVKDILLKNPFNFTLLNNLI